VRLFLAPTLCVGAPLLLRGSSAPDLLGAGKLRFSLSIAENPPFQPKIAVFAFLRRQKREKPPYSKIPSFRYCAFMGLRIHSAW